MIGRRFFNLTVVKFLGRKDRQLMWDCLCDCGNHISVSTGRLKYGCVKSCGCRRSKVTIERNTTHGLANSRMYSIWLGMKDRCNNPNEQSYKNYGARGISVCDEWDSDFQNFYNWAIQNGYKDDLSIERIDVNGNYCPENCTWIPPRLQVRNRRNTVRYTLFGIEKPLVEWAEIADAPYGRIYQRYKNGNKPFSEEELNRIESIIKE